MSTKLQGGVPVNHIENHPALELQDYWQSRVAQHHTETYAGLPMLKFPEDLRVYEKLIWEQKPDMVIELGCFGGGFSLWLRDRLSSLGHYDGISRQVVSVDITIEKAQWGIGGLGNGAQAGIHLIEGDVLCDETVIEVRETARDKNCLIIEDSAHTYETTYRCLESFSSLVPLGDFYVVEDGCVDIEWMRYKSDWPRGVLSAIQDWLHTCDGQHFDQRRDLEIYGLTCHPGGFLQRNR